jgi:hypothetical protein
VSDPGGRGPAATTHIVESTAETIRSGYVDPAAPPVAAIDSGDVVRYPDTWTHWGNEATFGMTFADREPLRHRYPKPELRQRIGGWLRPGPGPSQ